MTFEDWYETHFGDQPSDDSTVAVAPVAGGGAGSNELRQLWDRTPPLEPMRTEYLAPNFESNLPQVAAQPLPSPPYSNKLNYAGMALQELVREAREGTGTSPEALDEVRNNPTSLKSIATYGQWLSAIMMGGKGGEKVPLGPKGAVPAHIWNSWELATPGDLTVRVDNAGNHFKFTGSHTSPEGYHAIVKPVEPPGPPPNEKNLPDWAREELLRQGKNPARPLNDWDISNPSVREAIKNDPTLTQEQKDSLLNSGDYPQPEPGSVMDKWMKKHGGQNPFEPPPSIGDDFPEMPPGVKPKDYWGNAHDRKYSGPLQGQQWADIYATPDVEFTVPPKDKLFTPEYDDALDQLGGALAEHYHPGKAAAEWLDGLKKGDVTQEQYDAAIEAIKEGKLPPPPSQPPEQWNPQDWIGEQAAKKMRDEMRDEPPPANFEDPADFWKSLEEPPLPIQEWRKFWQPPPE